MLFARVDTKVVQAEAQAAIRNFNNPQQDNERGDTEQ